MSKADSERINVKIGNGRGGEVRGWPLVRKYIELAKTAEVVTVSPEQRARLLEWARRQTLQASQTAQTSIEPNGHLMSEAGAHHGEAARRGHDLGEEQPPRVTEGRRATRGRRLAGLFPFPRVTPAR